MHEWLDQEIARLNSRLNDGLYGYAVDEVADRARLTALSEVKGRLPPPRSDGPAKPGDVLKNDGKVKLTLESIGSWHEEG